jgi:hypothetical protein
MMEPFPSPLDEASNDAIRAEGLEELDAKSPGGKERHPHPFGRDVLDDFWLETERLVAVDRLIESPNRDADMVRGSDHTSCLGL